MIFASSHFHRDHDLLRGGGFALAAASDKSGLSKLIGEPFSPLLLIFSIFSLLLWSFLVPFQLEHHQNML